VTLAIALPSRGTLAERLRPLAPALIAALLFAAIGVEVMTLAAWMPDTLRKWWNPDRYGYGDFDMFYRDSKAGAPTGQYNVGIAFLMRGLTWMDMRTAYQTWVILNAAAMAGVAWLAQRPVRSLAAKVAVALCSRSRRRSGCCASGTSLPYWRCSRSAGCCWSTAVPCWPAASSG
jgi:hypothetical protein